MLQITISKRAALIIGIALLLVIPGVATATHIFTDVTDGNVHAPGIEWVADNFITTGCGDGSTYCPNDAVTRAQMGTFMCRLAGNCGVAPSVAAATALTADSATTAGDSDTLDGLDSTDFLGATDQAVDSDTLDGLEANELVRAAQSTTMLETALNETDGVTSVVSVTIDAPVDGFVLLNGSVTVFGTSAECPCNVTSAITDGVFTLSRTAFDRHELTTYFQQSIEQHTFVTASAGSHTYSFDVGVFQTTTDLSLTSGTLTALFVPYGSDGGTTLGPVTISPAPAADGTPAQ